MPMGICNAGLSPFDCAKVSVYSDVLISKLSFTLIIGVPDCVYQCLNWVRSTPEASDIALMKSSHVTAIPSKRLKYKSMPALNLSAPNKVWIIRITSAPFS